MIAAALALLITVHLDASRAPQKFYSVKETIAGLQPGALTLVYPKWIPGYHTPSGPIADLVGLHVSSGGKELAWRRDPEDLFAIHLTLPPGATSLDCDFQVVSAPSGDAQQAVLEFHDFVLYQQGMVDTATPVDADVVLPQGWTFGTALPVAAKTEHGATFERASLYTLIDSPVIIGAHERTFALGPHEDLDVASDVDPDVSAEFLTAAKRLVAEGQALYGGRRYRDYHFLLSLSDQGGGYGVEHHESSDNHSVQGYAASAAEYRNFPDLLGHEYSHSWNGKYRRPRGLSATDYQQAEHTDLLWIYEGLNQYLGELLATRSGFNTLADQTDRLAWTAANLDNERGRRWRSLLDVTTATPFLFDAPRAYSNERRAATDFYPEGDLMWLEADVTIRKLSGGTKSLDDFCKLWGNGSLTSSVPALEPYDEDTMLGLLGAVEPYDWRAFFDARVTQPSEHPSLGGIEGAGYRLVYRDEPSGFERSRDRARRAVDARYSLGATVSTTDGRLIDVLVDSPAFEAGLAPGMEIVAVDGRKYDPDGLDAALRTHRDGRALTLNVTDGDAYRALEVSVKGGPRYPHLERIAGTPDLLQKIYAPLTARTAGKS